MSTEGGPGDHEVGSLAEEAARLVGVLSGWAREHADDLGAGVTGLAGHVAAVADGVDEHLDTGSAACTYCPICRTVHAIRGLSPEVKSHLAVAATSFAQAVAALMAPPTPPRQEPDDHDVEHFDVTDDWSDDE